jgi:hypothetical protein
MTDTSVVTDDPVTVVEPDPAPVVTQSILQEYGTGIFSVIFSLLTALTTIQFIGGSFAEALQLIPIVVTGLVTWIIPLSKSKWAGMWKTGLDLLSIVAVIVLPFVLTSPDPLSWPFMTWVLIGLALTKASATELGIYIRTNTARALTIGS